ncbi:hypothetical protein NDU88_002343 [Pleurodeles waltl]|uniref:Uncharacterized protein n=1 Tax=Pleurodeles waltl TaxID=8319 RepID=A0AAV7KYP0_PLEWA|nr:hypothetical protein NDU88_002343 [Pleurodeles waltl]
MVSPCVTVIELGGVSRPAVRPLFSLNRPVYLRLRFPLPALRSPPALLACTHPCLNCRARPGLRRARRQHRASQTGLTGPRLPLLHRATSSISVAHTGAAHRCLGSRAGFSLRGSSGTLLCCVQRQHSASQARPDSGAYRLVAADPPLGRF